MTELEIFLVQAWIIWNQRNVVVHGGQMKDPRWLNNRATGLLEEYKKAQPNMVITNVAPSGNYWQPPSQDVYKLNFDTVVFSDLNCFGLVR